MAKTTTTTAKDRASAKTAAAMILARLGYTRFVDYDRAEKIAAAIVLKAIRDARNQEAKSLKTAKDPGPTHSHCWHATRGPVMQVMKDGYMHQTCCRCPASRTVHRDHAR